MNDNDQNVVPLPVLHRGDTAITPDPAVVAELEVLLERAKAGEIRAIAWAMVLSDNSVVDDFQFGTLGESHGHALMASVADLQFTLLSFRADAGTEDRREN